MKEKNQKGRKSRKEIGEEERIQMHQWKKVGIGYAEIGRRVGRDGKVVKRCLNRYRPPSPFIGYRSAHERGWHDHAVHKKRLRKPKKRVRLKSFENQQYVEKQLSNHHSPEIIAGRLRLKHPERYVSAESIYQWIYQERRDLIEYLDVVSKRGRRKRSSSYQHRQRQPAAPKRSLDLREQAANQRLRFGDYERDTVQGIKQSKACILNLRERKSRVVFLQKLHQCTAEAVKQATKLRLEKLPHDLRLTMTQDNGSENSLHHEEERSLQMLHYFCHPYSAWERGSVENANRTAVRKFFPKGTDFSAVNYQQVKQAETWFNNRPMKCLGFFTPLEVFAHELAQFKLTPPDIDLDWAA